MMAATGPRPARGVLRRPGGRRVRPHSLRPSPADAREAIKRAVPIGGCAQTQEWGAGPAGFKSALQAAWEAAIPGSSIPPLGLDFASGVVQGDCLQRRLMCNCTLLNLHVVLAPKYHVTIRASDNSVQHESASTSSMPTVSARKRPTRLAYIRRSLAMCGSRQWRRASTMTMSQGHSHQGAPHHRKQGVAVKGTRTRQPSRS
jgi:hypothetical protein